MKKNIVIVIISVLFVIFAFNKCEQKPTIVTKTKVEYIDIIDTITKVEIQEVPKIVFVNKYKTVKGNDSIVYVKVKNDSTIQANQYNTKLLSNNATADLKITTTGELLDVSGVIRYKEKETTTTTVITKPKSGLFLYGGIPLQKDNINFELGLMYQIKNKLLIGVGANYNDITNSVNYGIKLGIKL